MPSYHLIFKWENLVKRGLNFQQEETLMYIKLLITEYDEEDYDVYDKEDNPVTMELKLVIIEPS